jgi:transposase-like protein
MMSLKIHECPICGSYSIIYETGDFVCHDGFHIPNIQYARCEQCGENFYDKASSRAIDQGLYAAGRLPKRKYAQAV